MDQKEIIRREYFIKRKSMRQMARELRHSRKTIHKAIMDPGVPVYSRKRPRGKPVAGPYLPIIKQWEFRGHHTYFMTAVSSFLHDSGRRITYGVPRLFASKPPKSLIRLRYLMGT